MGTCSCPKELPGERSRLRPLPCSSRQSCLAVLAAATAGEGAQTLRSLPSPVCGSLWSVVILDPNLMGIPELLSTQTSKWGCATPGMSLGSGTHTVSHNDAQP